MRRPRCSDGTCCTTVTVCVMLRGISDGVVVNVRSVESVSVSVCAALPFESASDGDCVATVEGVGVPGDMVQAAVALPPLAVSVSVRSIVKVPIVSVEVSVTVRVWKNDALPRDSDRDPVMVMCGVTVPIGSDAVLDALGESREIASVPDRVGEASVTLAESETVCDRGNGVAEAEGSGDSDTLGDREGVWEAVGLRPVRLCDNRGERELKLVAVARSRVMVGVCRVAVSSNDSLGVCDLVAVRGEKVNEVSCVMAWDSVNVPSVTDTVVVMLMVRVVYLPRIRVTVAPVVVTDLDAAAETDPVKDGVRVKTVCVTIDDGEWAESVALRSERDTCCVPVSVGEAVALRKDTVRGCVMDSVTERCADGVRESVSEGRCADAVTVADADFDGESVSVRVGEADPRVGVLDTLAEGVGPERLSVAMAVALPVSVTDAEGDAAEADRWLDGDPVRCPVGDAVGDSVSVRPWGERDTVGEKLRCWVKELLPDPVGDADDESLAEKDSDGDGDGVAVGEAPLRDGESSETVRPGDGDMETELLRAGVGVPWEFDVDCERRRGELVSAADAVRSVRLGDTVSVPTERETSLLLVPDGENEAVPVGDSVLDGLAVRCVRVHEPPLCVDDSVCDMLPDASGDGETVAEGETE